LSWKAARESGYSSTILACQTMVSAQEAVLPLDGKNKDGLARVSLKGQFLALPVTDPLDGERVVCYRSFLPAANALV